MKLLRPYHLVILAGIMASMISCNRTTSSQTDGLTGEYNQSSPGSSYVLLTGLALNALANNPNTDSAACAQQDGVVKAFMMQNSQTGSQGKCCCPCPLRPGESLAVSLAHCLCPLMVQMRVVGSNTGVESISVGNIQMEPSDPPAEDSLGNSKIYRLPENTNLPDSTYEMVIRADLTGYGVDEYRLWIELKNGKPFTPLTNEIK